ncbi:MAG: U32 family peptidase [Myxococcota bacterium]
MRQRVPEILAPAGDAESLAAALAAGADAVYFGLDEGLNARARAANFPAESLPATVDQIHRAGARAYVTLNTLVFEKELPVLERLLRTCAAAGVDAVIVQDPAVALIARALAPSMEVHASTQMTISSPEAAEFARQLGVTRVVVPRELSVAEIRTFAQGTPLELEVFIHGALCMSWSGQCLTSEAWGGRSANRGQCAQSCRLPYELVVDGAVRPLGDVAYLLSPLDLAGARAVAELADAGVASLKIEGRLKGPQYVLTAVEGYRRWREAIARRQDTTREAQAALQRDLGRMAVAYSRGFSDGFLAGSDHQSLVEGRFPKHRGALLGEVVEVRGQAVRVRRATRRPSGGVALGLGGDGATHPPAGAAVPLGSVRSPLPPIAGASAVDARGVPLELPELIPGCGVGFDTGHPEAEEPGGPLFGVEPTADGWWLRFGRPGPELSVVKPGDAVYLSADPRLAADAKSAVEEGTRGVPGRIGVRLSVRGAEGEPLTARVEALGAAGRGAVLEGQTENRLEKASGAGLGVEVLSTKLGAFGGTPFRLEEVDLSGLGAGLHVPVSALKALRRSLLEALEERVLAAARHALSSDDVTARVVAEARALHEARALAGPRAEERRWTPPAQPTLIPLIRTAAQLEAVIELGLPEVELDWMELNGLARAVARAREAGLRVTVATTRIQKPGEAGVDERLSRLKPDGVLVRHWGGLIHFSQQPDAARPVVHGDFSLNVTNSVTAHHLLALGCDTLTAAHDLDEVQLHALLAHVPAERVTVVAHHHIATFHTEHCVYAHTLSHGRDFRTCGRPCEQHQVALKDQQGREHPVVVDWACRNTVFNAQAQSAVRAIPKLVRAGVRRFRAEFVWEDRATCARVLAAWQALLAGQLTASELTRTIEAHEQFGVTPGTMRTFTTETR